MSKLSFRARALDASKPLPVYHAEDLPDLSEYNIINRAVPEMPTGMEKEEETEHHLQRAMAAQQLYGEAQQLVIPTPDFNARVIHYEEVYNVKQSQPRQYIHVNALDVDTEAPDYDLDSEDEEWVNSQSEKKMTPLKFEEMIDRLEKGSGLQAQHLSLVEAQALLQGNDEDLIVAVFDYWQAKRQRYGHPLLPMVKTEKRDSSSATDHYVAFRRRTERMQTRKNRKNDEASYERMCKLRRDLERCCDLISMVKKREEKKREFLQVLLNEFRKRYELRDWTGEILASIMSQQLRLHDYPPHPAQPHPMHLAAVRHRMSQELYNQQHLYQQMSVLPQGYGHPAAPPVSPSVLSHGMTHMTVGEVTPTADVNMSMQWQRQHAAQTEGGHTVRHGDHRGHSSKRKHRGGRHKRHHDHHQRHYPGSGEYSNAGMTSHAGEEPASEEDAIAGGVPPAEEVEEEADGPFTFRRRKFVKYRAPRSEILEWPWVQGYADMPSSKRYRLYLTSISRSGQFVGLARRRLGRGGRVWLDRLKWPFGGNSKLEEDIYNGVADWNSVKPDDDVELPHYRVTTPPEAKRVKHARTDKWDRFPFVPTDDSWFEKKPLSSSDKKDFLFSATRVRLKPSTSLTGFVHKSLDATPLQKLPSVPRSPVVRPENGRLSPAEDSPENQSESSPALQTAAALIASVQGAAQKQSTEDCMEIDEVVPADNTGFDPSTKPDASVLQLNFPMSGDSADSNGPAAVANFNSETVTNPHLSKEGAVKQNGNGLSTLLVRQQNWTLPGQPTENGIPSPALVSPSTVAQLLNDSSPTTHNNPALASVLQVT